MSYIFESIWQWINERGLTAAIIIVTAMLLPRVGRLVVALINRRIHRTMDDDEGKSRLAFTGVAVYLVEMVIYFMLFVALLRTFGFSLTGAAIPAAVASAAIGFGSQSIIADFLAGFFILTEKQFGIGDWVRFEGNGIEVEGEITQITMRATRIRTLSQEMVIIPNSTARVCINHSSYFSRAVVVMPLPLLGSASPHQAVERVTKAATRALHSPDIAAELRGPLDVHPAIGVQSPSGVGTPWLMEVRLLIHVEAGSQWRVERAMRMAVLTEFFAEYGSVNTVNGERITGIEHAPDPHAARRAVPEATGQDDPGPTAPETAHGSEFLPTPSAEEPEAAQEAETPRARWRKALSLGGRTRASTPVLVALLIGLIAVWTFGQQPDQDAVDSPTPQALHIISSPTT